MAVGPIDYSNRNDISHRLVRDDNANLGVVNSADTLTARRIAFTGAKPILQNGATIDIPECPTMFSGANVSPVSSNGFSFTEGTINWNDATSFIGEPSGASVVFGGAAGQSTGMGVTGNWRNKIWESNGPVNFNLGCEDPSNPIDDTGSTYGTGIVHQRIPGRQFGGVNWSTSSTDNSGTQYNYRTVGFRAGHANFDNGGGASFSASITIFWQNNHTGWLGQGTTGSNVNTAINVNPASNYELEYWLVNPKATVNDETVPLFSNVPTLSFGQRNGSGGNNAAGNNIMNVRVRVLQAWNPRIVNATTTQPGTDIFIGKVDTSVVVYRKDDVFDTTNLNKTTVGDNFDYIASGFTGFLIQNALETTAQTTQSGASAHPNGISTQITNRDFRIWSYLLDNFDNDGDVIVHTSQSNNCAAINGVFSTFDEIALPESPLATISDPTMIPTVPTTLDDVAAIVHNNTRNSNTLFRSLRANGTTLEIIGSGESIISTANGISRENTTNKVITIGVGANGTLGVGTAFVALTCTGDIRYSAAISGMALTCPTLQGGSSQPITDCNVTANINVADFHIVRSIITPASFNLVSGDYTQEGGTNTLAGDLAPGGSVTISEQAVVRAGTHDVTFNNATLNNCNIQDGGVVGIFINANSTNLTMSGTRTSLRIFGPHSLERYTATGNQTLGVTQLIDCNIGGTTASTTILNGAPTTFTDSATRTPYILRGTYTNQTLEVPSSVSDIVLDRDTTFTGTCSIVRASGHSGTVTVRQIMQPAATDGGGTIAAFTGLTLGTGVVLESIPQTTRQETVFRINLSNQPSDAQYMLWDNVARGSANEVTFTITNNIITINQGIIRDTDTPATYVLGVTHRFRTPTFFVRTVRRNTATTNMPTADPDTFTPEAVNDESAQIATDAPVRTAGTGMNIHNGVVAAAALDNGRIEYDISGFAQTNWATEPVVQRTFAEVRHAASYLNILSLWHAANNVTFADGDIITRNPFRLTNRADTDLLNGHYILVDTDLSNQLVAGIEDTLPTGVGGATADFTRRSGTTAQETLQVRINVTTNNPGLDTQQVKAIPRATSATRDDVADIANIPKYGDFTQPIVGRTVRDTS